MINHINSEIKTNTDHNVIYQMYMTETREEKKKTHHINFPFNFVVLYCCSYAMLFTELNLSVLIFRIKSLVIEFNEIETVSHCNYAADV